MVKGLESNSPWSVCEEVCPTFTPSNMLENMHDQTRFFISPPINSIIEGFTTIPSIFTLEGFRQLHCHPIVSQILLSDTSTNRLAILQSQL